MPHPSRRPYVKRMQKEEAKRLLALRKKKEKGIDWRE